MKMTREERLARRRERESSPAYRWKQNHQDRSPGQRWFALLDQAERREKKVVTITKEDFLAIAFLPCYYCGGELSETYRKGHNVDRADNSIGYTPENILPCCGVCNTIKNKHLSKTEMKAAAEAIIKVRKQEAFDYLKSTLQEIIKNPPPAEAEGG